MTPGGTCQDPHFHTVTGTIWKGVTLPVLRCTRGTTSLEDFHLVRYCMCMLMKSAL